jgi:hypothetical protein
MDQAYACAVPTPKKWILSGQDVSIDTDAQGRPTRALHHMLKMFLIDPEGAVREIYSLAFMQPDVIFNDIRTLTLEAHR